MRCPDVRGLQEGVRHGRGHRGRGKIQQPDGVPSIPRSSSAPPLREFFVFAKKRVDLGNKTRSGYIGPRVVARPGTKGSNRSVPALKPIVAITIGNLHRHTENERVSGRCIAAGGRPRELITCGWHVHLPHLYIHLLTSSSRRRLSSLSRRINRLSSPGNGRPQSKPSSQGIN